MIATIRDSLTKWVLLFGAVFIAIGAYFGTAAYDLLIAKARAQEAVTEQVEKWTAMYRALIPIQTKWESLYRSESEAQDLLTVIRMLNLGQYGLSSNVDQIVLTKAEAVKVKQTDIGLTRLCLGTALGTGSALEVTGPSYAKLLEGIGALGARADITMDGMAVIGDRTFPTAYLRGFCLLVRRGGNKA